MATRTDPSLSSLASAVARFRAPLARVRRRLPPGVTAPPLLWALGALALAGVLAATYAAAPSGFTVGRYLRSEKRFSADDLIVVTRALEDKRIPYKVDGGRVRVAGDQVEEADSVVAKLEGLGPRSPSEILKAALESNPFELPSAAELRVAQARNEVLAELIRPLPGVVSATVSIYRPRSRVMLGFRPTPGSAPRPPVPGPSAFVYLETEGGGKVAPKTVQAIQDLVTNAEPDVPPEAVTVMDRQGNRYADANNPALGDQARNRVREDDLRAEILDQLNWLKGVQVSVRLVPGPAVPPPTPLPPLPKVSARPAPASAVEAAEPKRTHAGEPAVGVNRPLDLADEADRPESPEPVAEAPPLTPVPSAPLTTQRPAEPAARARVWVKVPRSYYLNLVPNREPSTGERPMLVARTEESIRTALGQVIPADQLGEVTISTIPDDVAPPGPTPPPIATEVRRLPTWALPAAVTGTLAATATALLLRRWAGRRPLTRGAAAGRSGRTRYEIADDPGAGPGPGPSARVRDLIRTNPEAAASALHRWTGQGGTVE